MNNLFVQFYNYNTDNNRYDLVNGFSDAWDLCKSKGDFLWIPWRYIGVNNKVEKTLPDFNAPFDEGKVFVSCSFLNQMLAVKKWAEKYPNLNFVIGGVAVLYHNVQMPNIENYKGSVEEYFGVENYSYEWKLEVPEEIKNRDDITIRYIYKIDSLCYWGNCKYCVYSKEVNKTRPISIRKTKIKKLSNAREEWMILGTPSIKPNDIKNWLPLIELEEGVRLRIYLRPDKIMYLSSKLFFDNISFLDKIHFMIAPEFLSQRMLDFIDKGTKIEDIMNVFHILDRYNVSYEINFIVGFPNLIREDVDSLKKFVKLLRKDKTVNFFALGVSNSGQRFSKVFPPPDNLSYWYPIVNSSVEVKKLNLEVFNIIKGHFNNINYNFNFWDSIESIDELGELIKRNRIQPHPFILKERDV